MNKAIIITITVILIAILIFMGYSETDAEQPPQSVLDKYIELEPQYKGSIGTIVNLCIKNNEKIYTVSGSGGFTGITFYYSEDGDVIGSYTFTDEADPDNPQEPPIDILQYECTIIKESEQFVKE